MVLIVSLENEASTNGVIDWLHFHGTDFIRISPNTPLSNVRLILGDSGYCDLEFMIDRKTVTLSQITGVWYRRGWFQVGHSSDLNALPMELRKKVLNQLGSDLGALSGFLSKMLFSGAVNKPSDNELAILARDFRFQNYALQWADVSCHPTNGSRCMGNFVSTPHTTHGPTSKSGFIG